MQDELQNDFKEEEEEEEEEELEEEGGEETESLDSLIEAELDEEEVDGTDEEDKRFGEGFGGGEEETE